VKKVCHITTVHPAMDVRIFHKECCSLSKAGYEVTLIVVNGEDAELNGVHIKGIKAPFSGRIDRIRRAPYVALEAALKVNADIYHFHDPEFLRVAMKLKKAGKKVVYDVHEDVPRQILAKYWIPKPLRKLISVAFEYFENSVAAKLDQIVAATPFIRERFMQVNRNTIDINNFPKPEEFEAPLEQVGISNKVCYIGGIERIRGIAELVAALEYSEAEMILAGKFSNPALEEEMKQEVAWKKVDFRGFQDRKGVNLAMQQSFAGMVTLHPTINYLDALPVKMFEYMAAGLAVIASDFPYWKSIIEKYDCGICVNPLDPKAIAEGMETLRTNPEKAYAMGARGREAILKELNWNIEAAKLLQVYAALAK